MIYSSLRMRLIAVLALALLPAAALVIAESLRTYKNATLLADRALVSDAVRSAEEERSAFEEARRTIRTIALLPDIMESDSPTCQETLAGIHAATTIYSRLAVMRASGAPVCALPGYPPGRTFERNAIVASMNENPRFMVTRQIIDAEGEPVVALLTPVHDIRGQHVGHVSATIHVERLERLLTARGDLLGTYVALVNRHGEVIAEARKNIDDARADIAPPAAITEPHLTNDIGFFSTGDMWGETLNYAVAPLAANDIYLLIGTTRSQWHAGFAWGLLIAILAPIAMYGAALGVAWYAVDRLVVRHIDRLRRVVDLIEQGRGPARANLPPGAPDEIGTLAAHMNEMLDVIDEREADLEAALVEQKLLTKEVYHRVKNNLQIISSLMSLQVRGADSDASRAALVAAQKRIQAMSSVHEQLYREEGLATIRLDTLVHDLTRAVRAGLGDAAAAIATEIEVAPLTIDPDMAIPLALLITETLTNAFEYTAPTDRGVPVRIRIAEDNPGFLTFSIANPRRAERVREAKARLGTNLVNVLARQLRGTLNVIQDEMYTIELVFPASGAEEPAPATAGQAAG